MPKLSLFTSEEWEVIMETKAGPLTVQATCSHPHESSRIAMELMTHPECRVVYVQRITRQVVFMSNKPAVLELTNEP